MMMIMRGMIMNIDWEGLLILLIWFLVEVREIVAIRCWCQSLEVEGVVCWCWMCGTV